MDPYTKLRQMRQTLEAMSKMVGGLEDDILNALKENTELKVENQLLREKLDKVTAKKTDKEVIKSQNGLESLRKIYDSGYHICNMYYGTHRDPGADCMFCLDILDNFENRGKI
ncbi:DNA replication initiation control protein YabA [Lactobacillus psittaci]|nr:DNA replication initiation control protein YabA [Lactobacillus psittaci]